MITDVRHDKLHSTGFCVQTSPQHKLYSYITNTDLFNQIWHMKGVA